MKVFLLILNVVLIKCFEEILVEVSIDEEQENGTLVVDLRSEIKSLSLLTNSVGYQMRFVRPCLNIYFDEMNKFKILSLRLDREKICPYESNCYLNCKLFFQKDDEIKLIKLKIEIKDINDHQPMFLKRFYSYEILNENLIKDYHIQLEQAQDKDLSINNSIKSYYLNSTNIHFPFKINFNQINHLLELILIRNLEEEEKETKYLFELIVIDGGNESDHCLIEINILKNQFSPPKFNLNLYQFFIYNSNQTFIGQVNATNSFNKQIYYRLIPSILNLDLFQINQITGEIYLKEKAKEKQLNSFYQIFIEAFYLNYISSLTTVDIYFNFSSQIQFNQQENDFIQILIPKLFQKQNQNEIYLKENSTIPLTILQLFISSSSTLQMNSSVNNFYLKQLDQQSFELILQKSFDYEIIQNIHLDFYLNYQNSTKKSIEIIILNINDCQPQFNQTNFHLQIIENNQSPFLLYTFKAFDQDQLNNINYEIQTKDENIFSMNSTSGELWILESLDREMKSNYSFLICAFDQIYRTCSKVHLEVLDENDNICKFNSSSITLTIYENLLLNTNLIQIQAFDPDYKQNGTLQYSFSSPTSYLNLNSTTGLIQTTKYSFDYELTQNHSFLIIVCDNIYSFPSLCCSLELLLNILDLNDNLPYLIYPSSITDLFIINYTNKTMPTLKALDNDISFKYHFIYFSIIGGSLNSSITIDYYSGQLNLLSSPTLPLYGTLIISISSQTIIQLTILIHDNQTDLQTFLMSLQQSSSSSSSSLLFYFIFLISLLITIFFIFFYFFKQKQRLKADDNPLMNTPSTTTLSARSLPTSTSASTSTNKKIYETYYSFGDTVLSPQVIYL